MNNLKSLFPPNYKNLEQKDAVKLLEEIEKVVEEMDKGCEYCNNSCANCKYGGICQTFKRCEENNRCDYEPIYNFCHVCGKDLRKEEL